mmetsp:Transcript_44548/g.123381  ORF Transcript_44548/g.123381 Transcript_44548/m.123381 type:complete len:266 (+) Transcript_44548:2397-3194(+)
MERWRGLRKRTKCFATAIRFTRTTHSSLSFWPPSFLRKVAELHGRCGNSSRSSACWALVSARGRARRHEQAKTPPRFTPGSTTSTTATHQRSGRKPTVQRPTPSTRRAWFLASRRPSRASLLRASRSRTMSHWRWTWRGSSTPPWTPILSSPQALLGSQRLRPLHPTSGHVPTSTLLARSRLFLVTPSSASQRWVDQAVTIGSSANWSNNSTVGTLSRKTCPLLTPLRRCLLRLWVQPRSTPPQQPQARGPAQKTAMRNRAFGRT